MKSETVSAAITAASAPPIQVVMSSTLLASIIGWLPLVLAIPAAFYYIILVVEKFYGKKFHEILRRRGLEDE